MFKYNYTLFKKLTPWISFPESSSAAKITRITSEASWFSEASCKDRDSITKTETQA